MADKIFEFKGTYRVKNEWVPFSKRVNSSSQALAHEHLLSRLGAEHRTPRRHIKVTGVSEVTDNGK